MLGMVTRRAALAGIALSALASPAQANGDGSFCIGPDYIAYELAPIVVPGRREHVLHVVSLTDSGGIGHPLRIGLPIFVVHGIRCKETSVELLGWDSLYTVPVRDADAAPTAQGAPWANQSDRRLPPGYTRTTFWVWSAALRASRSDTLALAVEATARRFVLTRDITENRQGPCLYNLRAQVVEFDPRGRALGSLVLADEIRHRECGN